jgi:3-phosphoshikimate 1-carboxyvinyltransferase
VGALAIEPLSGRPDATVRVPGSKSVTNRALVAAALAEGESRLDGVLVADDTMAMVEALRRLDVAVDLDEPDAVATVSGTGGRLPSRAVTVDARQSGTTARFLAPLLALGAGAYRLDGSAQLRARPMGPTFDALTALGARIEPVGEPGRLPVSVVGGGLRGGEVAVAGDVSSQFLSGLLLAGPAMPDGLVVRLTTEPVSRPYLDLTVATMVAFGATVDRPDDRTFAVAAGGYRPTSYVVEPDASAASYFFAAAVIAGGRVRVEGLGTGTVQGDLAFVDVLAQMGARWSGPPAGRRCRPGAPSTASTSTSASSRTPPRPSPRWPSSPTVPPGSAASASSGRRRPIGSPRWSTSCVAAGSMPTSTTTASPSTRHPSTGTVRTYDDHRMAMSFALLGLRVPGIEVEDPGCVAKTYPGYFADLAGIGAVTTGGDR